MASVNKVILVGRVGRDPEIRHTNAGKSVASFSVATSEKYDGKERTDWHNIVAFGLLADTVEKYVTKGMLVFIEGKIQYEEWQKDGEKKYMTKIIAFGIQFLSQKKQDDSGTPF